MDVLIEPNVIFSPFSIKAPRNFIGGVFDETGQPIASAYLKRQKETIHHSGELPKSYARSDKEVIYGGIVFGHYGHFLLETLARYWFIKENPSIPVVFHSTLNHITAWQRDIFSFLGIPPDQILVVDQPISYKRVYLADTGYAIPNYFSSLHAKALAVHDGKIKAGKKLWLSRSRLSQRIVRGEQELEHHLSTRGWIIFHAQEHRFLDQIRELGEAEHIAGFAGSAFHSLIFLKQPRCRVTIYKRSLSSQSIHENYITISSVKNITQQVVDLNLAHLSGELSGGGLHANFFIPDIKTIVPLFD